MTTDPWLADRQVLGALITGAIGLRDLCDHDVGLPLIAHPHHRRLLHVVIEALLRRERGERVSGGRGVAIEYVEALAALRRVLLAIVAPGPRFLRVVDVAREAPRRIIALEALAALACAAEKRRVAEADAFWVMHRLAIFAGALRDAL